MVNLVKISRFWPDTFPAKIFLLTLALVACLCGCSKAIPTSSGSEASLIGLSVKAELSSSTRTSLDGEKLSWVENDKIGVFVEGVQKNREFTFNQNGFLGYFKGTGTEPENRKAIAYYPYRYPDFFNPESSVSSVINGTLASMQLSPFDPKADYMVSDIVPYNYDESDMPELSLSFNHHLFSILRLTVKNSNQSLANERLCNVCIKSESHILSGAFTFDVSDGNLAVAHFSEDENETSKIINMTFPKPVAIGKDKLHELFVVIPSGTYETGDLSVTVFTDEYSGTVTTKKEISLETGTIYTLEEIDYASLTRVSASKSVVCFGDSITTSTVTTTLRALLGPEWSVYLAGVSGDKVLQIMARQGAAPLFLQGGFTIPASALESVDVGTTFYTAVNTNGDISARPDINIIVSLQTFDQRSQYCGLTNPFKVKDVECSITKKSDGHLYINRVTDGASVDCSSEEFVRAIPYASWKLGNPTVTTVYMGTNGIYTENIESGRTRNQVLADLYGIVKDSTTDGFIAVGYHHSGWNSSYKAAMAEVLGENYLDLRFDGCLYASVISNSLGISFSFDDYLNLSNGIWPKQWGGLDVHPLEPIGAKAHAYLIYYKMKELGYVD